jgi:hypothetical protein
MALYVCYWYINRSIKGVHYNDICKFRKKVLKMSKYSFEWYLKEKCRYGWLNPLNNTEGDFEK